MLRTNFVAGTLLLLLCASRTTAYQNAAHHYSITPPSNWVEVTEAEANRQPVGVHYDTGFKQQGSQSFGTTYVLVQFEDKAVTLDEFEEDLGRMKGSGSLPPNVTFRSGKVDRDHNRGVMELDIKGPGGRVLHCRTYSNVGQQAMVHVHCYTAESPLSTMVPVFDKVANSFKFDDGFAYSEATHSSASGSIGSGAMHGALIGAGIGAVFGVLIYAIKKSSKT